MRGVFFTAKLEGLWAVTNKVTEEDVRHMRNRCEEFPFHHVFDRGSLKEVDPCTHHLAEWIIDGADDYDAAVEAANGPRGTSFFTSPLLPVAAPHAPIAEEGPVHGFKRLMEASHIPLQEWDALLGQLQDLGAIDVKELALTDWQGLLSWGRLLPLQQRRLLQLTLGVSSV